jgi:hypothetical protein
MKKQTALWATKSGAKIRICDMTNSHLTNAIALLEQRAWQADQTFARAPNPFTGDIASDLFDQAQDDYLEGNQETDPEELFPIYRNLCLERERRGLTPT